MICDNKLTVRAENRYTLHNIEDLFTSHLREFDTFSEFMYSKVLNGEFSLLKQLTETNDNLDDAQSIDEIPEMYFMSLFGTRWIDVLKTEIDYNELTLEVYFDSHWTPPICLPVFLSEKFECTAELEAVESASDKAYYVKAYSLIDYEVKYMTYYEFQYKIKSDYLCLQQLFPFYESFEDFREGIEKEDIFLTTKESVELLEKYNSLTDSVIDN